MEPENSTSGAAVMRKRRAPIAALRSSVCLWAALIARAAAQSDLGDVFGHEPRSVEIATGYAKTPSQAPVATTVLTADDIEAMGVRTLHQALESVAGFQWQPGRSNFENVTLRGLNSSFDGRTLLMIDGLPIAQGFGSGHDYRIYETYPVENIDRIEVIRGPASALYGADAFAGVINIITRTATHRAGTQFGARAGKFSTFEGWLRHTASVGPLQVSAYFSGGSTSGYDRVVEEDLQTRLDRQFGTKASLAPGPINMYYKRANADVDMSLGPWRLKLGYYGLQGAGNGIGVDILDPIGTDDAHVAFGDLGFHQQLSDTLEVSARLAYTDNGGEAFTRSQPPGAFGGLFPRGVLDELTIRGRQLRTEGSLLWTGWHDHIMRVGAGYYSRDLYQFGQRSNAITIAVPEQGFVRIPTPGDEVVRLQGDDLAVPESLKRNVTFGFLQDEWQLADDWTLTTGIRVDGYSDFGTAANPRATLLWNTGPRSTLRVSYGHAFRAPGYFESQGRPNNPIGRGNIDLVPENLDSIDLGAAWWGERYQTNLTLFGFRVHDRISMIQDSEGLSRFVNSSDDEFSYGMEWEGEWQPNDRWRFRANYTLQQPSGRKTSSIGTAPVHNIYAEAQWKFARDWYVDLNFKSLLDRKRQVGDARAPVDDYTLVNFSLRRKRLPWNSELAVSLRNMFDVDAREPSNTGSGIVNDIPLAGINAFGELRVNF